MKKSPIITIISILSLLLPAWNGALAQIDQKAATLWRNPTTEYRMKAWWFFGYEGTTDDGITADVESLRNAGFGGVVYYDQNHAKDAKANGAEDAFSPQWWHHLRFAAEEARRTGLSFEVNISNGYCAGGRWIDAPHAMQRVASATLNVTGDTSLTVVLPSISGTGDYSKDIAVLAFPNRDDGRIRHFTARYQAHGKGRNGAMQGPITSGHQFSGYGFKALPDVGVLQTSHDSLTWHDVTSLAPMYRSQGGYFYRTTAFPAVSGRWWRVKYPDGTYSYDGKGGKGLREWHVGTAAKSDRWEERAALHSDFAEGDRTPAYGKHEVISLDEIINLTDYTAGDTLRCTLPDGPWTILRLAAVPTGAKSKHGRQNLLGYECDKLSAAAARLHWDSYIQQILDTLNCDRQKLVSGITMDSHEGGSQNWTPLMLQEFRSRRGYDLSPWLPVLAGYVVGSAEQTAQVLYDFRQTIADCIRDNYFGTFQTLATAHGLTFTAQAIGNALCIPGDAISVKQVVDKPQGEFWTYQQQGAYDVKDCSSAAHLYGKPIASAEAMTDCEYKDRPADLHRVANIAFSMGAQEFVVCATPHIPLATTTAPYVAGREYAINRSNPRWQQLKPVWLQAARSMVMLRQGHAAPDVLVFLGDDVPVKTLTNRLPDGLDGLDWDVCTADALINRLEPADGLLRTPDGITYKALLIARQAHISPATRRRIEAFRSAGIPVLQTGEAVTRPLVITKGKGCVVHTHRQAGNTDIFYVAGTVELPSDVSFRLEHQPKRVTIWSNMTGRRHRLKPAADGTFTLRLRPMESVFITFVTESKVCETPA